MNKRALLASAVIAGFVAGTTSTANASQQSDGPSSYADFGKNGCGSKNGCGGKDGCKGKKGNKDACGGKDGCKGKKKHSMKCKDGDKKCEAAVKATKEAHSGKNACGGKDGCKGKKK